MSEKAELVCVTGASGFIGSWLVHLLLLRGYAVHATVKDLNDERETEHLRSLEGASTRLRLFHMDLLDYGSIFSAVKDCVGVFHVASPCNTGEVEDPQGELIHPAVTGTTNVLAASREAGVRRVVLTSSVAAILGNPNIPSDEFYDENIWSDEEYCEQMGLWYFVSKTKAEKVAWKFAKEKGVDLVVVNPSLALGPTIPPTLNASMKILLSLITGSYEGKETMCFFMGCVHVKDVAQAHIVLYENPSANGRHICTEASSSFEDFLTILSQLYPAYPIPKIQNKDHTKIKRHEMTSKKLIDLGLEFIPIEKLITDGVESLRSKGFLD